VVQSQDKDTGLKTNPDIKWEVRKEYDENGNLIYYDSSCVQSWKHFDFPGPGTGHAFDDFDSLFKLRPFAFGPIWMDSFFPDSLFPNAFKPFEEFFPPSFHGPDVFFDRHEEWIEKLREQFTFPEDTLNRLPPNWQQLPLQQKKSARAIEI
jgi:hypothetical protein